MYKAMIYQEAAQAQCVIPHNMRSLKLRKNNIINYNIIGIHVQFRKENGSTCQLGGTFIFVTDSEAQSE